MTVKLQRNNNIIKVNIMEKKTKKKVCEVALALFAVMVVVLGYRFFVSQNGYWQTRAREADEAEYSEKRLLWRKSEAMTMQHMLQDLTLLANGDTIMVCWLTNIRLSAYRDFIHGKAKPTRLSWAITRYWYMSAIANGREWMQREAEDRAYKCLDFVGTSICGVQSDSTKDYRNEAITSEEARYNKMYPKLGKPADKEFEEWRVKRHPRWVRL